MIKAQDRKHIEDFEALCASISQATQKKSTETEAERQARIKRARADYRFFASYYFPHYVKCESADFHVQTANTIKSNPILRAVLEWYRGAAKSTNINVITPLWLKAQDTRQINTMVLVGKSEANAQVLLSDVQAELQFNERYIRDFGEQYNLGSWEEGEFVTKDDVAFFARGRGQSPRGLRFRANRPDYIVLDDIDDDELVLNESRVDKVVDWIIEALFGAMDTGRGRFIMVGNLIHERSALAKMIQKLKDTRKAMDTVQYSKTKIFHMRVNVYDDKGNLSWPQKTTKEEVEEMIAFMGYRSSQKELFNNPISEGKVFKKDWFQYKKLPPLSQYRYLIAYLDPGFKNNRTSDSKCLILVGLWKGEYHVIKVYCGKGSRDEMIGWHYDLDAWVKSRGGSCIYYMEEVFLQDLLYEDFAARGKKEGYQIPVKGDKRKKPDKDLRIEKTSGFYERGNVWWNIAEQGSHHMNNLYAQYLAFEPPKKTLKDGPDAFEGAQHLLQEMVFKSEPPVYGKRQHSNKYRY